MVKRMLKKQSRGVVFGVWAALLFSGCSMSGLEVKNCDSMFGTAPVTSEGGVFRFEKVRTAGKVGGSSDFGDLGGISKDAKELAIGETFFLEGLKKIQAPQAAETTLPVYRLVSSDPDILRVELSKKPLCCAVSAKKNGGCFSLNTDTEIATCANGGYNDKFGLDQVGAVFYRYDARLDALRLGQAQVVLLEGESEAVEKDRFTFHVSPHDWIRRSGLGSLGFVRYGLLAEREFDMEGKDGTKRQNTGLLVAGDSYTLERKAALLGDTDPMGPALWACRSENQAVVGAEIEKVGLCCPSKAESSAACREVRTQEAMQSCQADKETALLLVYRLKLEGRAAGLAWISCTKPADSGALDVVYRQSLSFEDPNEMSLSVQALGLWEGTESVSVSVEREGMTLVLAPREEAPVASLVAGVSHARYGLLNTAYRGEWSVTPAESASITSTEAFSRVVNLSVKKAELFEVSVRFSPQLTRSFQVDARNAKRP